MGCQLGLSCARRAVYPIPSLWLPVSESSARIPLKDARRNEPSGVHSVNWTSATKLDCSGLCEADLLYSLVIDIPEPRFDPPYYGALLSFLNRFVDAAHVREKRPVAAAPVPRHRTAQWCFDRHEDWRSWVDSACVRSRMLVTSRSLCCRRLRYLRQRLSISGRALI